MKTLDELFSKTTAKPVLYYKPLTDEDIARKKAEREERERQREERMKALEEERKRRREEEDK